MEGTQRRKQIAKQLRLAEKPVSASKFAQEFGVSRQIIVGDIALLRAAGVNIIATARGYKMQATNGGGGRRGKIAVQHDATQIREELETIINLGGEIEDVIVEHEIYGELVGGLHIKTQEDVDEFIKKYRNSPDRLLSDLTNGIHLHTIIYQQPEDLEQIKNALLEKGILYQN